MKFARIDSGVVAEIFEGESLPQFHPSLVWVSGVPDTVSVGWGYDGNSFSSPDSLFTVQEMRDARSAEVSALRDQKYTEGFDYNGKNFQVDLEAQKDMTAVQVQFLSGVSNPHGGAWRTSDNEAITMSDNDVKLFMQAAFTYVAGIKGASWLHKENIAALNAKSDIEQYDISKGWP